MKRSCALILAMLTGVLLVAVPPAGATPDPALETITLPRKRLAQADQAEQLQTKRQEIRERLRTLRAWKLTKALELDEATAARLLPILGRYDDRLEQLMREGRALRRELRIHMRASARGQGNKQTLDRQKLDQLIDRMTAHRQAVWELEQERFREARKVLTPEQAAKMLVVLPKIDRQLRMELRRAVRGGKGLERDDRPRRQRRPDRHPGAHQNPHPGPPSSP